MPVLAVTLHLALDVQFLAVCLFSRHLLQQSPDHKSPRGYVHLLEDSTVGHGVAGLVALAFVAELPCVNPLVLLGLCRLFLACAQVLGLVPPEASPVATRVKLETPAFLPVLLLASFFFYLDGSGSEFHQTFDHPESNC